MAIFSRLPSNIDPSHTLYLCRPRKIVGVLQKHYLKYFKRMSYTQTQIEAYLDKRDKTDSKITVIFLDDVLKHSPSIARRLKYSGMREGSRNLRQMQKMFNKIPYSYRVGTDLESTMRNMEIWLSTRHGSHIKSYKNGGSGTPENIVFERNIDNWKRSGSNMTSKDLIAIKYSNFIDNINHALENGKNAIKTSESGFKGISGISLIVKIFYLIANRQLSIEDGIKQIHNNISLEYIANDIATYIKMLIASLIPIVAEPLAKIDSSEELVPFKAFASKIMGVAGELSDEICKLLRRYNQQDIAQLTLCFEI